MRKNSVKIIAFCIMSFLIISPLTVEGVFTGYGVYPLSLAPQGVFAGSKDVTIAGYLVHAQEDILIKKMILVFEGSAVPFMNGEIQVVTKNNLELATTSLNLQSVYNFNADDYSIGHTYVTGGFTVKKDGMPIYIKTDLNSQIPAMGWLTMTIRSIEAYSVKTGKKIHGDFDTWKLFSNPTYIYTNKLLLTKVETSQKLSNGTQDILSFSAIAQAEDIWIKDINFMVSHTGSLTLDSIELVALSDDGTDEIIIQPETVQKDLNSGYETITFKNIEISERVSQTFVVRAQIHDAGFGDQITIYYSSGEATGLNSDDPSYIVGFPFMNTLAYFQS